MDLPKRPTPKLVTSPVPVTVVVREQKDGAPPAPEYRGIWKRGEAYARGDAVTCGGHLWIAVGDAIDGTTPGQSAAWKLAVKRGAPGADGEVGPMPRHQWDGTRLRFEQPDGSWGEWVDLKGPPGRDGVGGGVVIQQGGAPAAPSFSYFPTGW